MPPRIFIIYPSISLSTMEPFVCVTINRESYMVADYTERCPVVDNTWAPLAWWAGFFFFVYVVGIPVRS
jgi:hypothetical protein